MVPFEEVRPILSGLIGGMLAVALGRSLSRWLPKSFRAKSSDLLLRENLTAIRVANGLFILGIFGALALYKWAGFAHNDWRPAALGFGFAFSSPLVFLLLSAVNSSRDPREALVAFAIAQKIPLPALAVLFAAGVFVFFVGIWSVL